METKGTKVLTYLIIVVLLAVSGTPPFVADGPFLSIAFILLLSIFIIKRRYKTIYRQSYFLLLSFLVVTVLRCLYGKTYQISLFLLPIDVFLATLIIKNNFVKCYNYIMVFIAAISIFFWVGFFLSDVFYDSLLNIAKELPQFRNDDLFRSNSSNPAFSLYLYTIPLRPDRLLRNNGPFYEPGLFAVYLILSLTIMLLGQNKKIYSFPVIILMSAIITTLSTTAYIALSVLIMVYVLISDNISSYIKILFVLFIPVALRIISGLEFMSQKIITDYENEGNTQSRFFAMVYHWELIQNSPFIGSLDTDRLISPNGISMVLVYWGVPFSCVYYFYLYRAIFLLTYNKYRNTIKRYAIPVGSIIVVLITLFSQVASIYPLFYVLLFIGTFKKTPIFKKRLH